MSLPFLSLPLLVLLPSFHAASRALVVLVAPPPSRPRGHGIRRIHQRDTLPEQQILQHKTARKGQAFHGLYALQPVSFPTGPIAPAAAPPAPSSTDDVQG